ncbi:MAG TPA: sigma-70 region 4 domain-containing protein [Steroidobacteraceae bacterium]
MHAGIATLTKIDRAIILLYLEEHDYDEIVSVTGLSKTNVSVRLVRIKRALKDYFKGLKRRMDWIGVAVSCAIVTSHSS